MEPTLSALVVGDSFGFTLVDAMARSRLCNSIYFWFYLLRGKEAVPSAFDSRELRALPTPAGIGLTARSAENGRRMLEGKNLVVFVITTFNIDKFSWGFDLLVNRLYGNPDEDAHLAREIEVNLED